MADSPTDPIPVDVVPLTEFDAVGRRISYTVDGKPQVSFYVPPRVAPPTGTAPRIWVFCSGQSSLALDWFSFTQKAPVDDVGFLLMEQRTTAVERCNDAPLTLATTTTPTGFTLQWQRNDVDIAGANSTTLSVTDEGAYTVRKLFPYNCGNSWSCVSASSTCPA